MVLNKKLQLIFSDVWRSFIVYTYDLIIYIVIADGRPPTESDQLAGEFS